MLETAMWPVSPSAKLHHHRVQILFLYSLEAPGLLEYTRSAPGPREASPLARVAGQENDGMARAPDKHALGHSAP